MEYRERIAELVPRLRRYARALVGARFTADELLRGTLERASELLPHLRREPDLRIWLFSMMHDTYVESLYRPQGTVAAGRTGTAGDGDAPSPSDFEDAIKVLPYEQREVFLLITLEDMSYEEAARTLDIPLGTVMSRLSRAREKLRLRLMSQARLKMVK